jgi:hypothetical protein
MADDETPRPEFARELRRWFVAELERPGDRGREVDSAVVELVPAEAAGDPGPVARPRRWVLVLNAAAIIAALVSVVVVAGRERDGTSETSTSAAPEHVDPARATTAAPKPPDPTLAITAVCQDYALDAAELPLGAPADAVRSAADDVGVRLGVARADLAEIADADDPTGERLAESRRLLLEAIDAADRLVVIARTGDRGTIDEAVLNLDLIVLAITRQLEPIGGRACILPTLRETF